MPLATSNFGLEFKFVDLSVQDFSALLGSKAATPGGGGASALVGALSASLCAMVGNLTLGKAKYADVQDEVESLTKRALDLNEELLALMEKDAEAFEPLSFAYSIPKDNPDRDSIMEPALRAAAAVPFEILQACVRAIELHEDMAKVGSRIAISDVATGVVFARAALEGAAVNVKVNTKLMKDRTYADDLNSHVDTLVTEYAHRASAVYESIAKEF